MVLPLQPTYSEATRTLTLVAVLLDPAATRLRPPSYLNTQASRSAQGVPTTHRYYLPRETALCFSRAFFPRLAIKGCFATYICPHPQRRTSLPNYINWLTRPRITGSAFGTLSFLTPTLLSQASLSYASFTSFIIAIVTLSLSTALHPSPWRSTRNFVL